LPSWGDESSTFDSASPASSSASATVPTTANPAGHGVENPVIGILSIVIA